MNMIRSSIQFMSYGYKLLILMCVTGIIVGVCRAVFPVPHLRIVNTRDILIQGFVLSVIG